MTTIESIYEIKSAVPALRRFASSNEFVSKKVQVKYLQLLERFFRENREIVTSEQRYSWVHDSGYFLSFMDAAVEHYYLEVGE